MVRTKTSGGRSRSSRKSKKTVLGKRRSAMFGDVNSGDYTVVPYDPSERLKETQSVYWSLIECLVENDAESFREILIAHLSVTNKLKFAKDCKIGRQTLYDLLNEDKPFNPTFETIGSVLQGIKAA